jgi:hypothetical protein
MSTPVVSQLVSLLDDAFEAPRWHSLLANLSSVTPDDWLWVPPRGERSIRDIVRHVGSGKFMFHNHAFGDGQLTWGDPGVAGHDRVVTIEEAILWLREGHALLHQSISALTDADLLLPRKTHWGEEKEARWIIAVVIEHDLYHTGEINHVRALSQQRDRWGYDPY